MNDDESLVSTYLSRSEYVPDESEFLKDKLGKINSVDKITVEHNPPTGNEIIATRKKYKKEITKLFSLHSAFMILNLIFYKYTFHGNSKCKFALINYTESEELKTAIKEQGKFDGVIELPYKINIDNSKNHKIIEDLVTGTPDVDWSITDVMFEYSFTDETGAKADIEYDVTYPTYNFKVKKDPELELDEDNINTVSIRLAVLEIRCVKFEW